MGLRIMKHMNIVFAIIIAAMLSIAIAAAEEMTAVSPSDGATIDPIAMGFTFTTANSSIVSTCSLVIDNATVKTTPYNDNIKGKNINFKTETLDGSHTWQIVCESETGQLTTPPRSFISKNPVDTGVTVTASGAFRGSFDHTLTFTNTPEQKPIAVEKLAPGDFIIINLKVPPSTLSQQLYVKQASSKNGKQFLWLEDQKKGVEYYLYQGENVTINISTSHVIMSFTGMEAAKATIIVYSTKSGAPTPTQPSADNATEMPTQPVTPTEKPAEPAKPATPTENSATPTTPPTTNHQNQTEPEQPKQSFFKRLLAWFSNIFG